MLCVGLDPDPARMPLPLDGVHDATEQFCRAIVDAVADIACAIKPQVAFFSSQGEERALERICAYVCETYPDVTLILDAKRGDIGSTAEHYAREAFGRYGAHAVTVSPYLGTDSVAPYFEHGGAVFVLCRTSNPGGDELQSLVADGRPVYQHVAQRVAAEWSQLGTMLFDLWSRDAVRFRPLFRQMRNDLAVLIRQGQDSGEIEASLDAALTAGVIIGAIDGLLLQHLIDPSAFASFDAMADALATIFLRAMP